MGLGWGLEEEKGLAEKKTLFGPKYSWKKLGEKLGWDVWTKDMANDFWEISKFPNTKKKVLFGNLRNIW